MSERGKSALERGFSALPPELAAEGARLAERLVAGLTCPRTRAVRAIATALTRGEAPEHVELQLVIWSNWLTVEANRKGLRAPGLFVAAKILNAEPAPDGVAISWADSARVMRLRRILAGETIDDAPAAEAAEGEEPEAALRQECPTWEQVRNQLRMQLPTATYVSWVRDTVCLAHGASGFVVQASSPAASQWLGKRLLALTERTVESVVGRRCEVRFVAPDEAWVAPDEAQVH